MCHYYVKERLTRSEMFRANSSRGLLFHTVNKQLSRQRCSGQIQEEASYFKWSTSGFSDRDVQGNFKKRITISYGQQEASQTEIFRAKSRKGLLFHMVNNRLSRQRFSGQIQEDAYYFIWLTRGFPSRNVSGWGQGGLESSSSDIAVGQEEIPSRDGSGQGQEKAFKVRNWKKSRWNGGYQVKHCIQ